MTMNIAFFDVDETLIKPKSMFSLLQFFLEREQGLAGVKRYDEILHDISALAQQGTPREEINRHYYWHWKNYSLRHVKEAGQAWVTSQMKAGEFFIPTTVEAFANHKANGDLTVLVSGSFEAALKPISDILGADFILCTIPLTEGDRMTGEIEFPMIGRNKAHAAIDLMTAESVNPAECSAYGDHLSDLDLLELVGRPAIIPRDPNLIAVATARNWRILQ